MLMDNVNNKWDFIEHNINTAIEQTVPKKCVKKGKSVPWMSKEIRKICTKKKVLYKRFKKNNSHSNEQKFKECSKQLKNAIRRSHSNYSMGISKIAGSNPKKFWNYVRSCKKGSSQISFTTNDGELTEPVEIAHAFNCHFSNNFGDSSVPIDLSSLTSSPPSHGGDCLSFEYFSEDEVENILNGLDTSKSPGPDGILPVFLKSCAHELAPVLCHLFNECMSKGEIPCAWKSANVVPIYKGSGKPKNAISSYRPVSLTSILCKLLERLICKRILCYLDEHDILSDNQFGFRHGRSCEQMLAKFYHFLSGSLDKRDCNLVDGIFLDFSSAFDRVNHNSLLQKLHGYGIRGNVLSWIKSFLIGRKQRVIFQGEYSQWVPVTSGVPQGSVLGPVLFLLFVNDINDNLSSPLFQFADDHSLVRCIKTIDDQLFLQKDLDRIFQWTVKNNLPLNASKCAVVQFSRSKDFLKFSYKLGSCTLNVVDDFKLLGVVFNSSLSFATHIDEVCRKVARLTGFVIRLSRSMHYSALLHLFKALILPHLTYCSVIWKPYQKGFLARLERSQRKVTKVLSFRKTFSFDMSYESRLLEFELLKVGDLFQVLRLVFCFKLINLGPSSFLQYFHTSVVNKDRYLHCTSHTNAFLYSVFVSFPRLWNELPISVRSTSSINSFKNNCKDYYINKFM
jgi:hypothetical protein